MPTKAQLIAQEVYETALDKVNVRKKVRSQADLQEGFDRKILAPSVLATVENSFINRDMKIKQLRQLQKDKAPLKETLNFLNDADILPSDVISQAVANLRAERIQEETKKKIRKQLEGLNSNTPLRDNMKKWAEATKLQLEQGK